jgi:hypothetical protein
MSDKLPPVRVDDTLPPNTAVFIGWRSASMLRDGVITRFVWDGEEYYADGRVKFLNLRIATDADMTIGNRTDAEA